jgi:hypothetical protein
MQNIAMAQNVIFYGIVMILSYVAIVEATILLTNDVINNSLNRSSFPEGFIFGTASSAYQVLQLFNILLLIFVYIIRKLENIN